MDKKIAEIVHEAIFKVTGCKDLKADGMYLSKELEKAILALIAEEQKPMVEALKEAHKFIRNQYWDGSTAHLRIIDSINAVLPKGEGR